MVKSGKRKREAQWLVECGRLTKKPGKQDPATMATVENTESVEPSLVNVWREVLRVLKEIEANSEKLLQDVETLQGNFLQGASSLTPCS